MKIRIHNILIKNKELVQAGLGTYSKEIFDNIAKSISSDLDRKVEVTYENPSFEQIVFDRQYELIYAAQRIWIDLHIDLPELRASEYRKDFESQNYESDTTQEIFRTVDCSENILQRQVFAAQISNPGLIRVAGGGVHVDENLFCSSPTLDSQLFEELEFARKLGWPKEILVSFEQALEWLTPFFDKDPTFSTCKTSRALAAFSQIATKSKTSSDLDIFWAMMGLESLFCDSTEGLKKQLFDKASVIFGPLETNKKRIRKLYDFRSSFIHGTTNLPYAFTDDHDNDSIRKYSDDLSESESIAFLLLVATLQFLVKENIQELNFEYKISEKK